MQSQYTWVGFIKQWQEDVKTGKQVYTNWRPLDTDKYGLKGAYTINRIELGDGVVAYERVYLWKLSHGKRRLYDEDTKEITQEPISGLPNEPSWHFSPGSDQEKY